MPGRRFAKRCSRPAALVLALAAAGCATSGEPVSDGGLRGIIGRPVGEVLAAYGPPAERSAVDGGERYAWRYRGSQLVGQGRGPPTVGATQQGAINAPGQRRLPKEQTVSCRLEVDSDAAGIVRDWRARGDACPAVVDSPRLWRDAVPPGS